MGKVRKKRRESKSKRITSMGSIRTSRNDRLTRRDHPLFSFRAFTLFISKKGGKKGEKRKGKGSVCARKREGDDKGPMKKSELLCPMGLWNDDDCL